MKNYCFLKEFYEKVNFEKRGSRRKEKHELPSMRRDELTLSRQGAVHYSALTHSVDPDTALGIVLTRRFVCLFC